MLAGMCAQLQNLFDITWIADMEHEFIMLFSGQIALHVIGEKTMPKIRPFMRRKPGAKKRTIHVKGHYRHASAQ